MKNLHITNGESASGILKFVFKDQKINNNNAVYCFTDFLSIGPLTDLTTHKGEEKRNQYLSDMINKISDEEFDIKEIRSDIRNFYNYNFSDYDRIIVWYGENAPEELLKLLCCNRIKKSQLFMVNVSTDYIGKNTIRAVGECSFEIIKKLLPKAKNIAMEEYKQNKEKWNRITQSKALLRIYDSEKIKETDENYFDKLIIKKCTDEYTLLLKVTGEVMRTSEQHITDTFIIYRILYLIETKQIQYSGNINIIRTLLVKR